MLSIFKIATFKNISLIKDAQQVCVLVGFNAHIWIYEVMKINVFE